MFLGRMKIIDGSLWLRWLNVICDTFEVLAVERRRTTGLEKKLYTIGLTNSVTFYVFAGHYQTEQQWCTRPAHWSVG